MTRFSNSDSRIRRVMARNSGNLIKGIGKEALAKLYKYSFVRAISRIVVPSKDPKSWIFLVGCYNSGTTILKRVLESHPDIACLPNEGVKLTDAFPDLEAGGYPRMMYANRDAWDRPNLISAKHAEKAKKDWAPWWPRVGTAYLEKSIDHSIRMLWLEKHFSNAYFIHITRNPFCVGEGIRRRAKPIGEASEKLGKEYSPELVAEQWLYLNDKLRKDGAAVSQFHSVTYEDFTISPDVTLEEIFEFLGLSCPAMNWDGQNLLLGNQSHEILNQNSASLSRINQEDLEKMASVLTGRLAEYGYNKEPVK